MLCYADPVAVNHGVLCWWVGIMVRYAEAVVVNHGVLSLASGYESWYVMLSSGCESCCAMLSLWM
jgi:hypothetical protein